MGAHPLAHTLPVDAVKSVATSADEPERLVFLLRPSQHETAQLDRAIFESFTEALRIALGYKMGVADSSQRKVARGRASDREGVRYILHFRPRPCSMGLRNSLAARNLVLLDRPTEG
jgi:hypothetical protein